MTVSLKEILSAHPKCCDGKSFKSLVTGPCPIKPANPEKLSSWENVKHVDITVIVGGLNGYIDKITISDQPVVGGPVKIVNPQACVGCGACGQILEECPGKCFSMDSGLLEIVNAESCTRCYTCIDAVNSICPEGVTVEIK